MKGDGSMNIDMQNAFIAGLASGGVVVGDGTKSHAVIGNLEIASVPSGYSEYVVQLPEEITAQYVVSLGVVEHTGGAITGNLRSIWYYVSKKESTSFTISVYASASLTNLAFDWTVITSKAYSTCDYGVNNGKLNPYNIPSGTSSVNVVFDEQKSSADYIVIPNFGASTAYFAGTRMWVSNKSTTGFTINFDALDAVSGTIINWFCVDKSGTASEPSNVVIASAETKTLSTNTLYTLFETTTDEMGVTSPDDVCAFYSFRNRVGTYQSYYPWGSAANNADGNSSKVLLWTGGYSGTGQVAECAFVACQSANEGAIQ